MPTYSIKAPNGKTYSIEGPAGASREQVVAAIQAQAPNEDFTSPPERSWTEAATDVGAGVVSGIGSLVALPGQVLGAVTGDVNNISTNLGRGIRAQAEKMMSPALQAKKAQLEAQAQEAAKNGVIDEFITYAKGTVTDPALLSYLLAELVPSLLGAFGAGAAARAVTAGAARLAGKEATEQALNKAGTRAARVFGAGVEAGGAFEETYRESLELLAKQGVTGPEAEKIALAQARKAGAITGVTTGATSYLGNVEKILGGQKGIGSLLGTGAGEVAQGIAEGVTTTVPGNIALQTIDPTIETFRGTGSAAAAEALGGGIAGAGLGAVSGRGKVLEEPSTAPKLTPMQEQYIQAREQEKAEMEKARLDESIAKQQAQEEKQAQAAEKAAEKAQRKAVREGEALLAQEEKQAQLGEAAAQRDRAQAAEKLEKQDRAKRQKELEEAFKNVESSGYEALESIVKAVETGVSMVAFTDPIYKDAKKALQERDKRISEQAKALAEKEARLARRSAFSETEPQQMEMRLDDSPIVRPEPEPEIAEEDIPEPVLRRPKQDRRQMSLKLEEPGKTPKKGFEIVQELLPKGREKLQAEDTVELADVVKAVEQDFALVPESQAKGRMARMFGGVNRAKYEQALVGKTPKEIKKLGIDILPKGTPYRETIFDALTQGVTNADTTVDQFEDQRERGTGEPGSGSGDVQRTVGESGTPQKSVGDGFTPRSMGGRGGYPRLSVIRKEDDPRSLGEGQKVKRKMIPDEEDPDAFLYRTGDAPAKVGIEPKIAEKIADSWRQAKAAPEIIVAKTQADIPPAVVKQMAKENAMGAKGFYNLKDNKVYVIPENNEDARDIALTLMHEIVGHYGLRAVLGGQYAQVMRQAAKNSEVQKQLGQRPASERNVEEAIAEISERAVDDKLPAPARGLFNTLRQAVNKFLRAIGVNVGLTDNELYSLLQDSASYVMTGKGAAQSKAPAPRGGELLKRSKTQTTQDLQDIEALTGRTEAIRKEPKSAVRENVERIMSQGLGNTFRSKFIDKYDILAKRNANIYTEANQTNMFGERNPMGLIRQAEDAPRMVEAVQREGGMEFDEAQRLYVAKTLETNPEQVYEIFKQMAATYDATAAQMELLAHTALIGRRMKSIQDRNEALDKAIQASKKPKERQKLEERKVELPDNVDELIAKSDELFNNYPEMQDISDALNATRQNVIDNAVDAGVLTYEQGQDWAAALDYIPFNRVGQEDQVRAAVSKGLSHLTKLKRLKGSAELEIDNVFDNYFNMIGWMISQTMRNKAATIQIKDMVYSGNAQAIPSEKESQTGYVVKVRENGEDRLYDVSSPLEMEAFASSPMTSRGFSAMFRGPTRLLRASVTTMPTFGLSQVVQDSVRAAIFSGTDAPFKVMANTLKNFPAFLYAELVGKDHPLIREMRRMGITGAVDYNVTDPAREARIRAGVEKVPTWKHVVRTLEKVALSSDLAARAAVYEQLQKEYGDTGRAAEAARELINFRRKGSSQVVAAMIDMVPFFNATVQGLDNVYRSAIGRDAPSALEQAKARKVFFNRMLTATAVGMAYALLMSDNEEYENTEDYVKDRSWILPGGIRIPMPAELGFVFKVIPERVVRYTKRYGTPEEQAILEALVDVVKSGAAAYSMPNATPQLVKPILEQMTNYSIMTGREIVPSSMREMAPFMQKSGATSGLAIALGETLNLSPLRIDAFIGSTFGIAGNITLQMYDGLMTDRIDRPIYRTWYAKDFTYDPNGSKLIGEFYQFREEVREVKRTYDSLLKTDTKKAGEYISKRNRASLYQMYGWVDHKTRELGKLRQLEQFYRDVSKMPDADRQRYLDNIKVVKKELIGQIRAAKAAARS